METSDLRGMGWLPDVPKLKDYTEDQPEIAKALAQTAIASSPMAVPRGQRSGRAGAAAAPALVAKIDLRPYCSPVEDQMTIGSCTATAAVGLVEYFERRALGKHLDASRLFVYKTTRNMLGWKGDTGAFIRTAMGALVLFGTPPEQHWPYDVARFDEEPSAFCYAYAQNFQAVKYYRLDTSVSGTQLLDRVKAYLAAGLPSMFGFPVYQEFMRPTQDGLVAYPQHGGHSYGGHAIMAVGYDDNLTIHGNKGALLIRNSWGTAWGLQGYAWMSYRYVTDGLALDWWSLISQEWVDTGAFKQ